MASFLVSKPDMERRKEICKVCLHRTEKRIPLPAIFGRDSVIAICGLCGCAAGARWYFGCPAKHW
jgi:hypothetical protein